MQLIIGLGNPGEKYANTRHNVGFMALDKIANNFFTIGGSALDGQFSKFNFQIKFNAEVYEDTIDDKKVILVKPQTFMNESGKTVKTIMDYYKIPIENIIVIHDDLDITLGKYKIVRDRTSAGHKGVQSIIDNLGTKDFKRIRVGIGVENKKIPTEVFVLENFTKEEQEIINKIADIISSLALETKNSPNVAKSSV